MSTVADHPDYGNTRPTAILHPRKALNGSTIFVTTAGGVIFTIDPEYADACAERLTRFIPDYARTHITAGDYWIVTEKYAETARKILLLTTGTTLRLWAPSFTAALERLARHGRIERAVRQADRGAA